MEGEPQIWVEEAMLKATHNKHEHNLGLGHALLWLY
jgi:hypothetical protein